MSAEAITDEEILTEILSEMEDDVSDSFEGEGAFEFVVLAVEINTHTKYCLYSCCYWEGTVLSF